MALDVGVIGVGMIGQEHVRRLDGGAGASRVVAVADADAERAGTVAGQLPAAKVLALVVDAGYRSEQARGADTPLADPA